jgi:hypothetical protein
MNRHATGASPNIERLTLKSSYVTQKRHNCRFIIRIDAMVADRTVNALFACSLDMKLG